MSNKGGEADADGDRQVEMWKVKKLIKSLTAARGNGTSMISLVIPPKDQVSRKLNYMNCLKKQLPLIRVSTYINIYIKMLSLKTFIP